MDHSDRVRDATEVCRVVHVLVEILLLDLDKAGIGMDEARYLVVMTRIIRLVKKFTKLKKKISYSITASYKIPSNVDQVSKTQQQQLEHFSDPQILCKVKSVVVLVVTIFKCISVWHSTSLYCTSVPLDDDMDPSVQQD